MDMRRLFEDFKKRVESLDDDAIRQNIARAIEHSSNSSSLLCDAEIANNSYVKSSTQSLQYSNAACGYSFSSSSVNVISSTYIISDIGGVAA